MPVLYVADQKIQCFCTVLSSTWNPQATNLKLFATSAWAWVVALHNPGPRVNWANWGLVLVNELQYSSRLRLQRFKWRRVSANFRVHVSEA